MRLVETLWKNICLIACIPSSPKSHTCWPSPYLFGAVSQSYLRCCFPGFSPHFAPKSILTRNSHIVLFFFKGFPLKCIYFNWRIIILQYFGGFCHTSTWVSHGCTSVPPSWTPLLPLSPTHPPGLFQRPALNALLHASNFPWSSGHLVYIW